MGLTVKAKVLLSVVAAAVLLLVVSVSLVVFHKKQSTEQEGRQRLEKIANSLERSAKKMLDLVEQSHGTASRRVAREVNIEELRSLEDSVDHLARSLSEFANVLNDSGFSNLLARFQQDLAKYDQLLTDIRSNQLKIDTKILSRIKTQEESFAKDEKELFEIGNITRVQSAVAAPVVLAIGLACNQTREILIDESAAEDDGGKPTNENITTTALPTNETTATTITPETTTTVITDTSSTVTSTTTSPTTTTESTTTRETTMLSDVEIGEDDRNDLKNDLDLFSDFSGNVGSAYNPVDI